jgi:hypothetical protein
VEDDMVGRVIQANVLEIVVTGLAGVFEGGGLKDRHADRALDAGLRLAGVNELGFYVMSMGCHE